MLQRPEASQVLSCPIFLHLSVRYFLQQHQYRFVWCSLVVAVMVMAVAAPVEKEGGRRLGNKPYLIARTPSADLGIRPPALVLDRRKYHL